MDEFKEVKKRSYKVECHYPDKDLMARCSDLIQVVIKAVGEREVKDRSGKGQHFYDFILNFKEGRKYSIYQWYTLTDVLFRLYDKKIRAYYPDDEYQKFQKERNDVLLALFDTKLGTRLTEEQLYAAGFEEWYDDKNKHRKY